MAERQVLDQQPTVDSQLQLPSPREDMIACVMALEAALLPCLPARELQAIDRSTHPSHQIDVERHARDFMEAAKRLQQYFTGLQHEDQPTKAELLHKVINIGFSGVILNPWSPCIATVDCISFSYSTKDIPGFASTILTSLNPVYWQKSI